MSCEELLLDTRCIGIAGARNWFDAEDASLVFLNHSTLSVILLAVEFRLGIRYDKEGFGTESKECPRNSPVASASLAFGEFFNGLNEYRS